MSTQELVFNGINGETGGYLLAPMPAARFGALARGQKRPRGLERKELEAKARQRALANFAVAECVDANDLARAGWAVVFPAAGTREAARLQAATREALSPLLAWRRHQATRHQERLYREYEYRPGESKQKLLIRLGAAPGPVRPEKVPYYLLLVGSPEEIPFHLQYQLDVQYAVGRVHFATLEEYDTYARGVVAAEQGQAVRPRKAAFFGVRNPGDLATRMSHEHLVTPLADDVARDQAGRGWAVERILDEEATADRFRAVLGDEPPAFLFTASHGLAFPGAGDRQLALQGALLCQDWRGPASGGIAREHSSPARTSRATWICAGSSDFILPVLAPARPRRTSSPAAPAGPRAWPRTRSCPGCPGACWARAARWPRSATWTAPGAARSCGPTPRARARRIWQRSRARSRGSSRASGSALPWSTSTCATPSWPRT